MVKRICIYLVGLIITALGISFIINSEVGTGPWDTVAVGLNTHLGLTIGTWIIITQGIAVLLTSIIEMKRPQIGAVIALVIRSLFLDFWFYIVFSNVIFTSTLVIQWLTFVTGVITLGFGIALYMLANFPKAPIDGLMVAFHHRFRLSLTVSRTIIEVFAVIIGFLLGGPVGLGTLIIALAIGRIIQLFNRHLKKAIIKDKIPMSA